MPKKTDKPQKKYSLDAALPKGLDPKKIVKKETLDVNDKFVLLRDLHEWFSLIVRQLPEYSRSQHQYQVDALAKLIDGLE